MRALAALLCLALFFAACGYKGPLYLPKPRAESGKPPPPSIEAPPEPPAPREAAPVLGPR